MNGSAYFIVGPTASGNSGVAHYIAEREGQGMVSADSMNLYRGMDINHIIIDRRLGMHQDLTGPLTIFTHQQLIKKEIYQLCMAGVTDRLVVKVLDPSRKGLAHGPQTARGAHVSRTA